MMTGRYVGIGSIIRYNTKLKRVVIDEPFAGTPAAEAGLKKGDIILSIDDSLMTDKDVQYVSSRLKGDAGTTFVLKIKRPSTGKEMQMRITRRAVETPTIAYYGLQGDGIGYLNLTSFTEGCAKEVRRAFLDMKQKGMKGFVLDLRGNGGGSLDEAVQIVNMFVPKGLTLVKTRGKLKRANKDYVTTVDPIDTVMPVVVLVNGETASARPRRSHRHAHLRQGPRATARGPLLQRPTEADHRQVLHTQRPLHTGHQLPPRPRRLHRAHS